MKKKTKDYTQMTAEELAEATAEFDREFIADSFGPPPPEALRQLQRAMKRGRPRVGQGVRVVSVSVEKGLLNRSDALAKKLKVSRATLVTRGLQAMLLAAGEAELTPATSSAAPSRPRRSAKTSRRMRRKVA